MPIFTHFYKLQNFSILEDIRFTGLTTQYGTSPQVNGRVLRDYQRSGDRGGGNITSYLLQVKINGIWQTVKYE